ncbi:M28 family peptidase [Roseiconus nitratireducens]|uniref:M28 family peptidase n=1 Tax=Roseiconus nitratireducens TaxID=2605748 RepID=A0A5M6D6N8_9BACT|nr:M28 family peptidase [Roseiconus nitratireducens]KAA5543171.1 M28 family peptidase [Roseiconus nitratireducens]
MNPVDSRSRGETSTRLSIAAVVFAFGMLSAQATLLRDAVGQEASNSGGTTEALRQDVQYLASEELRGRSVTDETIQLAAKYVADRMRSIGLQTDQIAGTPFQSVDVPVGSEVGSQDRNFCRIQLADEETIEAQLGDGFGPLAIGKENAKASGRLVFAGYGITSAEHDYDDYDGVNAEGAVVMILRKEPGISDPDSPFDGVKNTRHAFFATKIANAISHGAVAVLLVNDPASVREATQDQTNRIAQEQQRREGLVQLLENLPEEAVKNRAATQEKIDRIDQLIQSMRLDLLTAQRGVLGLSDAGRQTKQTDAIPVASLARDLADRILSSSGSGLESLEDKIDQTFRPASRDLESVTATVSVDLKPSVATSDNVIGVLPGKGSLADQTLVVGAHYDHVGMGGFGSLAPGTIAVHNGADDNASGTAAMLGCAGELVPRLKSVASHRTVMFIAFTAEERGLVGSQWYVQNPVRPLGNTAAMINLDMVGRLRDNELTVYGTGTADGLESLVDAANERFGFKLYKVASGYGPSDHQSFYRAKVPVLFFFTGLHNDYHRPSDDFDKIDFGDLTRLTDMVSDVAFQLATRPQRPRYAETEKRVQIRRQMTAFLGVQISQRDGSVRITGVTPDGPASKAGLQIGDQIQRLGEKEMRTTADVLSWVRNHSPGDRFEIKVMRNATELTLRGELEKRSN